MQINHMNIFYSLGWSHAKVLLAQDILESGNKNKINKLFSEVAPQVRAIWSMA